MEILHPWATLGYRSNSRSLRCSWQLWGNKGRRGEKKLRDPSTDGERLRYPKPVKKEEKQSWGEEHSLTGAPLAWKRPSPSQRMLGDTGNVCTWIGWEVCDAQIQMSVMGKVELIFFFFLWILLSLKERFLQRDEEGACIKNNSQLCVCACGTCPCNLFWVLVYFVMT